MDPDGPALEAARRHLGLSNRQAWLGYLAVGGNGSPADMALWLAGSKPLPRRDHDLIAQSINDVAVGRGGNHPAPYLEP
ncbi:MAG TPA: hypothetical protein VGO92_04295 [Acidimicrobiales bacterium]|nr:hypothetical protein [Acidimicrobiales bacterium]